ncbi:MAG: hypothetical protein H8Z69_03545 [Nanohaloarchaea archaeon]|nr:hypothetical protein [Candidatus Nanohaloarchaea archaeon]
MKKAVLTYAVLLVLVLMSFGASAEDSNVGVSTDSTCSIGFTDISSPGNTSTEPSYMGIGEKGFFSTTIFNTGNANISVNVSMEVTREPDVWEPGEPTGEPIDLSLQTLNNQTNDTVEYSETYFIPHYITSEDANVTADEDTEAFYMRQFRAITDYGGGNYTGRLDFNYTCQFENNTVKEKSNEGFANFAILDTLGESGGTDTANNTGEPTPEDINDTGDTNATIGNKTGNSTSDVTQPQDANQTGEESNTTVEGDNPNPGETPVPEPEPEPVPEPTPGDNPNPGQSRAPVLKIDIEPVNSSYDATQGSFAPAQLYVQNIGNATASDIEITPEITETRPDWQVRNAEVANLSAGENVTREVFVRPPEDQEPGRYIIPVRATNPQTDLDLDYFTVDVKQDNFTSKVSIQEAPSSVSVKTNATQPLPILIQNTGRKPLQNITARFQNTEDCGVVETGTIDSLGINESGSLDLSIKAANSAETCNATMIVSSADGAYSFSNINFSITPEEGLIPQEDRPPVVAIIWTILLALYAILKNRMDADSVLARAPFVFLLMGEVFILLYMTLSYYGVFSVSFLPF